jgi:DNA mismatch repair protein MutS2
MLIDKNMLIEKTIKLLEFDVILERLARCSMSEEASAMIRAEKPLHDPASAVRTKTAVRAVVSRIHEGERDPRSCLPSIGFLLPRLDVEGIVLEIDEACAIGLFCERGEELMKWLPPHPFFAEILSTRPDCTEIAGAVFRVMDREGKLRDLPELRAIRRRIQSLNAELEKAVSLSIASEDVRRMLQSVLPSQRDGRTVLAVKANYRGRIQGIVHEVSSSGQTVFIEPENVVEKKQ